MTEAKVGVILFVTGTALMLLVVYLTVFGPLSTPVFCGAAYLLLAGSILVVSPLLGRPSRAVADTAPAPTAYPPPFGDALPHCTACGGPLVRRVEDARSYCPECAQYR